MLQPNNNRDKDNNKKPAELLSLTFLPSRNSCLVDLGSRKITSETINYYTIFIKLFLHPRSDLFDVANPELKWAKISGCASENWSSALFNATFRPLWGIALGLLIILCDSGNGFFVETLLAAKPFNVIGKLSYCIYIFHYFIIVGKG